MITLGGGLMICAKGHWIIPLSSEYGPFLGREVRCGINMGGDFLFIRTIIRVLEGFMVGLPVVAKHFRSSLVIDIGYL